MRLGATTAVAYGTDKQRALLFEVPHHKPIATRVQRQVYKYRYLRIIVVAVTPGAEHTLALTDMLKQAHPLAV